MKRWLQPTAIVSLLGALAVLLPAWADAKRATMEAEDARWRRENGMAFYEQSWKDELSKRMALTAAVLAATNLAELQKTVKANER